MADVMEPPTKDKVPEGMIRIDGNFLRAQMNEAVTTFFAPLIGVYAAARGEKIILRRRRKHKKVA